MKTISYHQKKIAYELSGKGPVLVLVHGFPMDHRVWAAAVSILESNFTLICPDLPGFGQSEMLGHTHPMELMAGAINAILEHEKVEKTLLVGHSMGGYVSLAFAAQHPEKLAGLVLFHSHAAADDEAALAARALAIEQALRDSQSFVSHFAEGLFDPNFLQQHPKALQWINEIVRSQPAEAVVAALAGMRDRGSKLDVLHQLAVSVLFILGKTDSRMPFARLMAQVALPPKAELMLLSDVGHMGYLEAPETIFPAIRHFAIRCFGGQ